MIFCGGGVEPRSALVVGGDLADRTWDQEPLWPSEHAAVLARVTLA